MKQFFIIVTVIFSNISYSAAYDFKNQKYEISRVSQATINLDSSVFKAACLDFRQKLATNVELFEQCQQDGPQSLSCVKLEGLRSGEKLNLGERGTFEFRTNAISELQMTKPNLLNKTFLEFEPKSANFDPDLMIFKKIIYRPGSMTQKMVELGLPIYSVNFYLSPRGPELKIFSRDLACDLYENKASLEFESPIYLQLDSLTILDKKKMIYNLQLETKKINTEAKSTIEATVKATSRMYSYLVNQKQNDGQPFEIEKLIHQVFPIVFKNENLELRDLSADEEAGKLFPPDIIKYEKTKIILN